MENDEQIITEDYDVMDMDGDGDGDGTSIVTKTTVTTRTTRGSSSSGDGLDYTQLTERDKERHGSSSDSDRDRFSRKHRKPPTIAELKSRYLKLINSQDSLRENVSTKRLSGSKFAKFEQAEPAQGASAAPKSTKRLDTGRFAKFTENNSAEVKRPVLPNYGRRDVKKTLPMETKVQTNNMNCHTCGKRVYEMEKITADKQIFHKLCFRCTECKMTLRAGNYTAINDKIYCKPHFTQLFKLKGNYKDGFEDKGKASKGSTPTDSSDDFSADRDYPGIREETENNVEEDVYAGLKNVKDKFEQGEITSNGTGEYNKRHEEIGDESGQFAENEPILRTDVLRATDEKEEPRALYQGLKSARERFEAGSPEEENVRKSYDYERELKQLASHSSGDEEPASSEQFSENVPELREDVVRSSDKAEVTPMPTFGGLKSLKDKFEKGDVKNAEVKPRDQVIIKYERKEESDDEVDDNDVDDERKEEKEEERVPVLSYGGARSLTAKWESGQIRTVATVEKTKVEMPVKSYSEDEEEMGSGEVSENNPTPRDDVVRESDYKEEVFSCNTKLLRSMWEKGEVKTAEKTVKKIEIPVRSLEDYDANEEQPQISENQPIRRDDVVRADDTPEERVVFASARSLRDRWEKGEVETAARIEKQKVTIPVRSSDDDSGDERGHVAENEPVRRDDVVRESDDSYRSDIISTNARSLRDRWEKGEVETVAVIKKEKVELPRGQAEDSDDGGAGQVFENVPVQRQDVARESDRSDDEGMFTTSARTLKDQWESGNVSHAEFKSEKVETSPRSLDDFEGYKGDYSFENEPETRDDRARESDTKENIQLSVSASAMKNKWESGDVAHADFQSDKVHLTPKSFLHDAEDEDDTVNKEEDNPPPQQDDVSSEHSAEVGVSDDRDDSFSPTSPELIITKETVNEADDFDDFYQNSSFHTKSDEREPLYENVDDDKLSLGSGFDEQSDSDEKASSPDRQPDWAVEDYIEKQHQMDPDDDEPLGFDINVEVRSSSPNQNHSVPTENLLDL